MTNTNGTHPHHSTTVSPLYKAPLARDVGIGLVFITIEALAFLLALHIITTQDNATTPSFFPPPFLISSPIMLGSNSTTDTNDGNASTDPHHYHLNDAAKHYYDDALAEFIQRTRTALITYGFTQNLIGFMSGIILARMTTPSTTTTLTEQQQRILTELTRMGEEEDGEGDDWPPIMEEGRGEEEALVTPFPTRT